MHALFYSNSSNYLADVQGLFVGRPQTLTPFTPHLRSGKVTLIPRLFRAVRAAFGYTYPNYEVKTLAQGICADRVG